MKKWNQRTKFDQLFPSPWGRRAADAAVDKMDDVKLPMSAFLDAWENAYWVETGTSPFRPASKP